MNQLLKITTLSLVFVLPACGTTDDSGNETNGTAEISDTLVEDAAFMVAIEELDSEAVDEVPTGSPDDAAEEDAERVDSDIPDVERDCSFGAAVRRVMSLYDADEDGELSEDERGQIREDFGPRPLRHRRAIRHHRRARLAWVYDMDESGDLDEDERAQLRADLEARCELRKAEFLATYDEDGSGDLDEDEWEAVRIAWMNRHQERIQAVLDEFDADENGRLDREERRAFRQARRERHQQRRQAFIDEFDTNGDGELDADERAAARAAIQARIRGEAA